MQIRVIVVGKIKETFTKEWIAEYQKRLRKYCRVEVFEIKEEITLQKEAEKILDKLKPGEKVIALALQGTLLDSETFAHNLQHELLAKNIVFVIGSDKGLDGRVLKEADLVLSFGAMTFSHQLARVVLFEQLYRAFTIMKGEPYHK